MARRSGRRDVTAAEPEVRLLDARVSGMDARRLLAYARSLTEASGAPHSSRSYRYPFAVVAWHTEPVGVDIERVDPCDAAFADLICTPAEHAEFAHVTPNDHVLTALWCSKEALAKALGDATDYEPRRLESPMRWPNGCAGPWRAVPLPVAPGHTGWVCWRASDAPGAAVGEACPRRRPAGHGLGGIRRCSAAAVCAASWTT
jgi:hypothetical protein